VIDAVMKLSAWCLESRKIYAVGVAYTHTTFSWHPNKSPRRWTSLLMSSNVETVIGHADKVCRDENAN